MNLDSIPEQFKLKFEPSSKDVMVAKFEFGEYRIILPKKCNYYMIALSLFMSEDVETYVLDEKPKTYRVAAHVAQEFHIQNTIPKIIKAFEERENARNSGEM